MSSIRFSTLYRYFFKYPIWKRMRQNKISDDHVIAELVNMGFEFDVASKAVDAMGPNLEKAADFVLNAHCSSTISQGVKRSKTLISSSRMKQSTITNHFSSFSKPRRSSYSNSSDSSIAKSNIWKSSDVKVEPLSEISSQFQEIAPSSSSQCYETDLDWEKNVNNILLKHFGISSMKSFQKEALEACLAHKDCLVLAATGSGKSLCFQIPAILTGKVVIVISPLISLMHDQCLKLSKHGIAACFLGSGQTDKTVEQKAMGGMYKIVYVCPETILRLMDPLIRLAENHGIALFAIDEVHCVSKWGHDFRPDYRRLSILRKTFTSSNLKFLEVDIPIMALTATATIPVRDDIIKSLHMSEEAKIVLTSFFRPNLRFSVKHSRTSSTSSYQKDFNELINTYALSSVKKRKRPTPMSSCVDVIPRSSANADDASDSNSSDSEEDIIDDDYTDGTEKSTIEGCQLTAEYLEDDVDIHDTVDDFDVSCGEFPPSLPFQSSEALNESEISVGPTIIYTPTRKETVKIADFLSKSGVKAAAYHAKLPKTHLRRVHQDFHQNLVEVVVATIAFGMGIDKSNVRRIIHYGWPQSLEAYYQEAGRAGRDGKLSDCTLYANLSIIPTLLPNKRSEEQTNQAYKMLSECFRYGMNTATCRAKLIVNYFGEGFHSDKCHICDVCTNGPPEMQNMTEQAAILMHAIKSECEAGTIQCSEYSISHRLSGIRTFRMLVSKIREQNQKYAASDVLWWRGLGRILEDKGLIREATELVRVTVNNPELTESGLRFISSEPEQALNAYPEADMLLSLTKSKPYSSFSEWGRGWADPEIRRQRLQGRKWDPSKRKPRKPRKKRSRDGGTTVRGRISSKIAAKQKHY